MTELRSYTSNGRGFFAYAREFLQLYRQKRSEGVEAVRLTINRLREVERLVEAETGVRTENLKMLDIGPGQKLRQMSYFSCRNDVVGIDLDEVVQGWNVLGYLRMLRRNGLVRTLKTVGRKAMGYDRKLRRLMAQELGVASFPKLRVHQMDATRMTFSDGSFDFVYSFSVFEHLPDPGAVVGEVARVLRPGGVACISLHLYTAEQGCHDPRILYGPTPELPSWPHLRPAHAHKVRPNAYLNKVSLAEWEKIFAQRMPGVRLHRFQYGKDRLVSLLKELRAAGELTEYTDEDLLTVDLVAIWKKPGAKDSVQGERAA